MQGYAILAAVISALWMSVQPASSQDFERRLNTVTVKALGPDKGELHINPIVLRPQDFQRPGYSELELVFVPVALIEDRLEPLLGEENRDYLRLVTEIPERPEGVSFKDSARDYFTQSVILPRGYYVLSEVTFRRPSSGGQPDIQAVSHCLADNSILLRIKGGDVIYMGRPEFDYPSYARLADPSFSPAQRMLDQIDRLRGWRDTATDLEKFEVQAAEFERTTAFCSPEATAPIM